MGEDTCMVDMNKYLLSFYRRGIAARYGRCRVGVRRIGKSSPISAKGKGRDGDIELLEKMALSHQGRALCTIWVKTSAQSVLATLRYFKEEYRSI